jgi:hypothetical protein
MTRCWCGLFARFANGYLLIIYSHDEQSCIKAFIPLMRAPFLCPNYLTKAILPNIISLVRISTYEFGGEGKNIQSITPYVCGQMTFHCMNF